MMDKGFPFLSLREKKGQKETNIVLHSTSWCKQHPRIREKRKKKNLWIFHSANIISV